MWSPMCGSITGSDPGRMYRIGRRVGKILAQARNAGAGCAWILPTSSLAGNSGGGQIAGKILSCRDPGDGDLPTLQSQYEREPL